MRERERFVDALRAAVGENDNRRPGPHASDAAIILVFNINVIVKEKNNRRF